MGTKLQPILKSREVTMEDLSGKRFAVDSFNMLYQFITTIRQPDGTPLMDSQGRITSHLSGLFFRTANLLRNNMKLAFVFDGIAPELKKEERERRAMLKQDAAQKYQAAVDEGDVELMKKYAGRTSTLTKEMIDEAKELISALGQPIVQAPSEGEAQASFMVRKGDFYALLSQDTDGLLFGSPRLVKNLSISGKKKRPGSPAYETVNPEIIELAENLDALGIDNDQLIAIGMLCGTDFNIGGVKGIGPKKALALVKKHGRDMAAIFGEAGWKEHFNYPWEMVFSTIKDIPVNPNYDLKWGNVDTSRVIHLLVEKHEFSRERVDKIIEELSKRQAQKGLSDFF